MAQIFDHVVLEIFFAVTCNCHIVTLQLLLVTPAKHWLPKSKIEAAGEA